MHIYTVVRFLWTHRNGPPLVPSPYKAGPVDYTTTTALGLAGSVNRKLALERLYQERRFSKAVPGPTDQNPKLHPPATLGLHDDQKSPFVALFVVYK